MFRWKIPLSDLDFGPEEESAMLRVLRSKWLSMGPEVEAFEREFAAFLGVQHAIAVSSATAALHLAYLALDLRPGDEILQPALNFVAAANMTAAIGAVPVFADILSLEEPTLDPADLERKRSARTRAVVVMHYGGYLCRMAAIRAFCQRHRLALIEDACHAIGARYEDPDGRPPHGRLAGDLGDIACFSFFSNKNLATGEGGMVVTNREDLAQRVRRLRSHGMTLLTWDRQKGHASSYDVIESGYNYRLDEMRAALGRCQLAKLPRNNQRRRELVALYRRRLAEEADLLIPFAHHPGESAYHLMVAVAADPAHRARLAETLKDAAIQTSLHYPSIPDFEAFRGLGTKNIETARAFSQRTLTLPLFPTMKTAEVEEVCSCLGGCAKKASDPLKSKGSDTFLHCL
jgi:dTDP-4-amino-4,6-dideoxygalactose transaminase